MDPCRSLNYSISHIYRRDCCFFYILLIIFFAAVLLVNLCSARRLCKEPFAIAISRLLRAVRKRASEPLARLGRGGRIRASIYEPFPPRARRAIFDPIFVFRLHASRTFRERSSSCLFLHVTGACWPCRFRRHSKPRTTPLQAGLSAWCGVNDRRPRGAEEQFERAKDFFPVPSEKRRRPHREPFCEVPVEIRAYVFEDRVNLGQALRRSSFFFHEMRRGVEAEAVDAE